MPVREDISMVYNVKNGSTLVVKDLTSTPKARGDGVFKEKGGTKPQLTKQ